MSDGDDLQQIAFEQTLAIEPSWYSLSWYFEMQILTLQAK